MSYTRQNCLICAWREKCAKRFSISDCGERCPDFSRDVSIRIKPEDDENSSSGEKKK